MKKLPVQAQDGALYSVESVPCPDFVNMTAGQAAGGLLMQALVNEEIEGENYECGVVTVPENYANPAGQTLELVYLRMFSWAESPAPDPLLYLSGGPGGPGLHELQVGWVTVGNLQAVRADRDVVVYDQRGTGNSRPLLCGPFQAAVGAAIELEPELADTVRMIEDNEWGSVALNYLLCAVGYEQAGVDLTQINSIVSTQDMANLMTALDYDQYNLYGTSYGTKLAQIAVRETPERVRSIVLDGTVDITLPIMVLEGIEKQELYVHLFELCAADEACNAAYPNLPERFTALLDEIQANPIALDEPIIPSAGGEPIMQIDEEFFEYLMQSINLNPNALMRNVLGQTVYLDYVPRIILALEEGDIDYIRSVIAGPEPSAEAVEVLEAAPETPSVIPDNEYVANSIDVLLQAAQQELSDVATPPEQWVALALNDLAQRLLAGEEQTAIIDDMITLTLVPVAGTDPQALIDYANDYLPAEVAAEAHALVETMSRAEVRATMWSINNDVAGQMHFTDWEGGGDGLHYLVNQAINCPESTVFHSQADVDAAVAAAAYPQLDIFAPNDFALIQFPCTFLPPSDIDKSVMDPVGGDTPALLIQGAMDTATPLSYAEAVASRFSNSTLVLFDSEGHVVIGKELSCAGAIAAQFLNDPLGDIDTSCADAFSISFVLPE